MEKNGWFHRFHWENWHAEGKTQLRETKTPSEPDSDIAGIWELRD